MKLTVGLYRGLKRKTNEDNMIEVTDINCAKHRIRESSVVRTSEADGIIDIVTEAGDPIRVHKEEWEKLIAERSAARRSRPRGVISRAKMY